MYKVIFNSMQASTRAMCVMSAQYYVCMQRVMYMNRDHIVSGCIYTDSIDAVVRTHTPARAAPPISHPRVIQWPNKLNNYVLACRRVWNYTGGMITRRMQHRESTLRREVMHHMLDIEPDVAYDNAHITSARLWHGSNYGSMTRVII